MFSYNHPVVHQVFTFYSSRTLAPKLLCVAPQEQHWKLETALFLLSDVMKSWDSLTLEGINPIRRRNLVTQSTGSFAPGFTGLWVTSVWDGGGHCWTEFSLCPSSSGGNQHGAMELRGNWHGFVMGYPSQPFPLLPSAGLDCKGGQWAKGKSDR